MPKISPVLQALINACGPSSHRSHRVIVILEQSVDWEEELRQLREAGLDISSQEEVVGVVFGLATPDTIARLAELPAVGFIEPDEGESDSGGAAC